MPSAPFRDVLRLATPGRRLIEITAQVQESVRTSGVDVGLCHLFLHHTSASLLLCENADPTVLRDLEAWFARAVPDGDALFRHTAEGPDDMPAHVRSILTQNSMTLPVQGGVCDLGTWQGVFLWEHRTAPHQRRLSITAWGA